MIFKKINTFLSNIFDGNSLSKLFLASTLILISNFFTFESGSAPNLQQQINTPATASYVSTGLPGNAINENYIIYNKSGLQPLKIYTSYLPPKNTYNNNAIREHTLEPCGIIGSSGLDMIGNDCMIKIPFDCSSPPPGNLGNRGVNCLDYNNVFKNFAGKNLNPIECTGAKTDKTNCLSTNKPYCHNQDNPILGINCKLAPCNAIPNQKFRRPGVNCLADCNQPTSAKHIMEDKFFMEGFNCLSSCDSLTTAPPNIGNNCVLKFNDYVMPLCNKDSKFSGANFFNKSSNDLSPREQCLDVIDLPICNSQTNTIHSNNCVNECANAPYTGHGISCINFTATAVASNYTTRKCHHY